MPSNRIQPMYPPKTGKTALAGIIGTAAAGLLISTVALWEGKENDPYRDIVGVWTVCYGETRVPMRPYTDAECEDMLAKGLADFSKPVLKRNPELAGHPNQIVAAVSLAYNIGQKNYANSTVAKRFSAGNWRGACDAILLWRFAGGREVRGLVRRREYERRICLSDLPK